LRKAMAKNAACAADKADAAKSANSALAALPPGIRCAQLAQKAVQHHIAAPAFAYHHT